MIGRKLDFRTTLYPYDNDFFLLMMSVILDLLNFVDSNMKVIVYIKEDLR